MRSPHDAERGMAAPETLGLDTRVEIRKAAIRLLEEMPEGVGRLVIDLAGYEAHVRDRKLELTHQEFELLKFLAQQRGKVFTREQLLARVWGYRYYGGTRTVDIHVRRLRAKLGPENETLIGTVRNVGYRFVLPTKERFEAPAEQTEDA